MIPFSIVFINSLVNPTEGLIKLGLILVLIYLVAELLLDFVFNYDFRSKWITHIPYILLEYAAFFGLIYAASAISKSALWLVSITFWIAMGCLIFLYTRRKNNNKNIN